MGEVVLSRIRWLAFAIALLPTSALAAQRVVLTVDLGKATFFEDEPIYGVMELKNLGSDTLWVEPFGLPYLNLVVHLSRNGARVPEFVFVVDYVSAPGWRGVPIAPDKSLYETCVLQDRWGTREATSPDVFIGYLAVGSYELTARFASSLRSTPHRTLRVETGVVRFDVRPRSSAEDSSFREFERVRRMAWDLSQRPRYLSEVLALIEARVSTNKADPYLPFLLRNGIATAAALGQSLDDSSSRRIAEIQTVVAEAQKDLPSGAVVVSAIYSETPDRVSALAELLGGSIAGRFAADWAERIRTRRPF
jgi:hypothetical protein